MNKKQLETIEKLKQSFLDIQKQGLYIFLHEGGLFVCKESDINRNIKGNSISDIDDNWHQIIDVMSRDKAIPLFIDIEEYNS